MKMKIGCHGRRASPSRVVEDPFGLFAQAKQGTFVKLATLESGVPDLGDKGVVCQTSGNVEGVDTVLQSSEGSVLRPR